jgi:two-component system, chemotaxis family, CheB/CheR fusion protein
VTTGGLDNTSPADEARAKLAAIVESSDDAIVSKTLDGVILTWNKGAQRIFGYTPEEAIGRPILDLIIPVDRRDEEPRILERIRSGARVDHFETIRHRKDGTLLDVSVTISPVRDSTGRIIAASKIARDITEQKRIRREIEEARRIAEAASRAKDHFLSVLSHELRTPLTPVLMALALLEKRGDIPGDVQDELMMIRRNVKVQAQLVDDLLDLTRINRGKVQLHFEVTDAHAVVRTTLTMFQQDVDAREITVSTALRAREHHVWADAARLQQVFANLMSNAVKFTPAGGNIALRSSNDASGRLVVSINDDGIGIEPDVLARLFQPFEQGEQGTTSRKYGGLGLGLSISRSLAEMHEGTIQASSAGRGHGSTFEVSLPALVTPAGAATSATTGGLRPLNLRVLLVEDHADSRRILGRLLESYGCTVRSAGTVADALDFADHEPFDVLISDIGLPDGTGIDVVKRIRAHHDIKAIALSGFGQADDLRRSEEAGFSIHLTKPVDYQALHDVIEKVTK